MKSYSKGYLVTIYTCLAANICFLITSWSMLRPGPNLPGESIFIIPELFDMMYTPVTKQPPL